MHFGTRVSECHNGYGVTYCFLIGFEAYSTGGILGIKNTIKSLCMRKLQALERKSTVVSLENHVKLLYIYVYVNRYVMFSTLVREASFCTEWWVMQRLASRPRAENK